MENHKLLILIFLLYACSFSDVLDSSTNVILRDIKIKGEFPLFEKNITDALTIMPGDSVNLVTINNQIKNIEKYLKLEGFTSSSVNIEKEYNKVGGFIDILFRINMAKRIKMRKIKFEGNQYYSNFKLSFRYNIWDYFIFPLFISRGFNKNSLKENQKDLLHFYRKSGFPECEVSSGMMVDSSSYKADVDVSILEGPRYKWNYDHIRPLRKDDVRSAFNFTKRGNLRDVAISRGINSLKEKLYNWGYTDFSVQIIDTIVSDKKSNIRKLQPIIKTEDRIRILKLNFLGNNTFKRDDLEKIIWSSEKRVNRKGEGSYTQAFFREDLRSIKNFYRSEGFYKVHIKGDTQFNKDSTEVHLSIIINEDRAALIESIKFTGDTLNDIYFTLGIDEYVGNRYRQRDIEKIVMKLASTLSEDGFPDVKIKYLIDFSDDSTKVNVAIDVQKNQFKKVGDVLFSGNFRTKTKYLLKESGLNSGDAYVMSEISKAMSEIRNTNLFNRVYYKLEKGNDSLGQIQNIKIFLSEKEALKLKGAFGYETENGAYVKFDAANHNIFGYNKVLSLNGGLSPEEKFLGLKYVEPDFFIRNSSLWISLYVKTEELISRTVKLRKFGNSYGVTFNFLKNSNASLGLAYELRKMSAYNENIEDLPDTINVSLIGKERHVLSAKPKLTFDGRDSFIRPKKGGYSIIQANISNGLNSSNSDDYIDLAIGLRGFLPITKKITLAVRARGEGITPYGKSDSISVDQLLTIGGNSSVRGYEEDKLFMVDSTIPLAGFITLYSNIELRVEIAKIFEALLFLDGGTISSSTDFNDLYKPKFSSGLGFSLLTPIGPIGLAYGFKLRREGGEEPGQLHFSIGYIF